MGSLLTPLDGTIFFGSLFAVMAVGLWAGRKEDDSQDYYLAGRQARWWGVAASIFGSNISANHMVGMMGLGFSVGFAQSHFEITAIAGLMLLCYGFLPVYRRLNVYTLSEYLSRRYNETSRVIYALIMLVAIVVIQMVPAFYIGSRSLNILLQEQSGPVDWNWYAMGIVLMAVVTGTYTIIGGLKAVIITDVLQSILMLVAAVIVALLLFAQPEIGGWGNLVRMDAAEDGANKLHLYESSSHPDLPWSGLLTGLMILHFNYWATNQFIVQRALAARSDRQARFGIIIAGFLKLLIPYLSIGAGIAAFYFYRQRNVTVASDATFPQLLRDVVAPLGYGVVGLVAAGLIGAILSSIDSMMNSAATLFTFDFYKRYINPDASEKTLIRVGRISITVFIIASAALAIFTMDPNSQEKFFLIIAKHQAKLVTGLVIAFAMGMFWKRATGAGAVAAIGAGIVTSYALPAWYLNLAPKYPALAAMFGEKLNFMHTAAVAAAMALIAHVAVSLCTSVNAAKSRLTWTDLGGHDPSVVGKVFKALLATLGIIVVLAVAMVLGWIIPLVAALLAAVWVWTLFIVAARNAVRKARTSSDGDAATNLLAEDRFWAGGLCAAAIFMMFYYY